jgi:hypothetical protein
MITPHPSHGPTNAGRVGMSGIRNLLPGFLEKCHRWFHVRQMTTSARHSSDCLHKYCVTIACRSGFRWSQPVL